MQDFQPCLLSLFAFSKDAREVHGAVQWLLKAYEDYRNRVSNRKMGYKAFLEENLVKLSMPIILDESSTYADLQQEVIDRDKVKHILENRKFTEEHFNTETFEEANAIRMISIYNAIGVEETVIKTKGILPIADYPQKAKAELAEVFRNHVLLCPALSAEDLVRLLTNGDPACKYMVPPCATNRDLGFVLHLLIQAGAIKSNRWSSIVCKYGMLLTTTGLKMQSKNLNAARSYFIDYKQAFLSEKQRSIEQEIMKVLSGVPNAIKFWKK